jgi:Big-like domain-containing protein/subtilase family protein
MTVGSARLASRPQRCVLAVLAAACALAPASAEARSVPAGENGLSSVLVELAKPSVRGLAPRKQALKLDLSPSGPGSLLREGNRVLVDVNYDRGAIAGLDALRAAGARIVATSGKYQTVTAAVSPSSLPAIAAAPGVGSVSENRAPILYGEEEASADAVGAACEGGSVISEGISQLQVADARGKYGVSGSGVTVGVLSDSFDQATEAADGSGAIATHAAEDVASEDLPGAANACGEEKTPVNVLEDLSGSGSGADEGRAMLQIVHDVAPSAALAFATAFNSETSFAQNIERLAKSVASGGAGAKVIVDDVAWFEEPFFQDGPVANAVDKVALDGVTYLSAAGNDNLFEGSHEIASWETPSFRDSGGCPAAVQSQSGLNGTHCLDFKPGAESDNTFGIKVSAGATLTLDLQWAEPWYGVGTDLDAFVLSGGKIAASAVDDNADSVAAGGTQKPVEVLQWTNTQSTAQTVNLAVNRFSGLSPRVKFALLENGSGVTQTEYPTSSGGDTVGPTVFGHTGATGAVSVAATRYGNGAQPEPYSSRGPVTHYYGPVSGTIPALPLGSAETIAKPDITATDCGATTFFASYAASEATWRFCGTSAAAPHAAGVAALELDAEPGATVSEVRAAQTGTATAMSAGSNAVGAGLLDADAAVGSLLPATAVTITEHPASRTADSTPTFAFSPSGPHVCKIDGTTVSASCTSPYTVATPLADGVHTFEVDDASFTFTVDTVPPAITFTKRPPPVGAETRPSFAFASDEPAAFTCALDGAAPRACGSTFDLPSPLADGTHTFEVAAVDQVGNSSRASVDFTVDTRAPTVSITAQPAATTTDRRPIFSFTADEPAAFACSLDAGPSQPCGSPFQTPVRLADGAHAFTVDATDLAGNTAGAKALFTVDTRPPQTYFAAHPPRVVRTHARTIRETFRFRSNETGVTFVCKIDRALPRFCGSRISRRFPAGRHTVQVRARDAVGNVDRTPAVFHFRVRRLG